MFKWPKLGGDTGDYLGSAGSSWCAITAGWHLRSHLVTFLAAHPLLYGLRTGHLMCLILAVWPHTTHHRPHRPVPGPEPLPDTSIHPTLALLSAQCSVRAMIILGIIHYPASNNTQTGQIFTGRVSVMALISDASNTPLSGFMGTISASLNCWWQKVTLHSW